jgi:hypothetical protein
MKDDTLPPNVNKALDAYLAESNSKLLVVLPLKDERESESKKPPRSAIMMECFEPAASPEQLVARLEVVGRHATSALYNAAEHRRIPMRFLWAPLAKVQDGLGGKARAIVTLIGVGLVLLIAALVVVPYPLKMEAKGQLLPIKRAWIYAPTAGSVTDIKTDLRSGSKVSRDQPLILMNDLETVRKEMFDLELKIETAEKIISSFKRSLKPNEQFDAATQTFKATVEKEHYKKQLESLIRRVRAERANPGEFWLLSPLSGIVLTGDFRETLLNRFVKPNEPLLRIGEADKDHPRITQWEIELKIPQKHIGQVLAAFGVLGKNELDVDLLLSSRPTAIYKAKLHKDKIAKEANPNRDDHNESEPVVLAWARLFGEGIRKEDQLPPELLLTGIEVHTRVRCGNHAMGYSLFYGVWEFIYEKVVFFF